MKPDKVENIDEQQQRIEKEKAELEKQLRQREEEKRERGRRSRDEKRKKKREKKKNRQSQVQAAAQQATFAPYSLTLASGYFMCISGKTAKTYVIFFTLHVPIANSSSAITTPASDLRSWVLLKAASLGDAYSGNTRVWIAGYSEGTWRNPAIMGRYSGS